MAAVANCFTAQDCNIVESSQYLDHDSGRFFMRVRYTPPINFQKETFASGFLPVATAYGVDWENHNTAYKPRVMIMVSKIGHCLNDLLYRHSTGQLPMELVGVVSNHKTWQTRVEHEGIAFHYLPVSSETKAEQELAILRIIEEQTIDLVVLARYMQVLSADLCQKLNGRSINIHHSFLPSFKGARPYHQAFEHGVKLVGATAHYVTSDLDEGPIIEQGVARIDHAMTPDQIVAKGRNIECQVLASAVAYHLEHRIVLNGVRTIIFK